MAPPLAAQGDIHALRETIARIEGSVPTALPAAENRPGAGFAGPRAGHLPLGLDAFDRAMGGGFPAAGLAEIRTAETRDFGAASAFTLALMAVLRAQAPALCGPLVWISAPETRLDGGEIWMPGIAGLVGASLVGTNLVGTGLVGAGLGGAASPLVLVQPARLADALWAAEAAAGSAAVGAAFLELRGNPAGFGLAESRRLHLRARATGRPLFILRQAGEEEASAAPVRFSVAPAPAAPRRLQDDRPLAGSLGRPAFAVTLEKSRLPAPPFLILEWNPDDCRFDVRHPVPAARRAGAADPGAQLPAAGDGPHRADAARSVLAFARAS